MNAATRRDLLAGAAVGASALLGATAVRAAEQVPEPSRAPGVGGTDPIPGDVAREAQNPDLLNPPATDSGTLPNLQVFLRRCACPAVERRLDTSGHRAGARRFEGDRRREHAAECGRGA